MELAPIVLFVFNRPEHTRQTLEALAANELAEQSDLYVYADAPRPFADSEASSRVREVRDIVRNRRWCGSVHVVESEWNRGLAASIVRGVTEVVERHGRVIVLEDDIVTRPGFLRFMNEALYLYENEPRVMQISGMIYGTPPLGGTSTAFLRIMSCHGWATWKRAWAHYDNDAERLLTRVREAGISRRKFDIEGHATFFRQLQRNCEGTLNTWAVKWYASWLTAGGYSLFPRRSLTTNIGDDGSGVHTSSSFFNGEQVDSLEITRIPVQEDIALRTEIDQIWRTGRAKSGSQGRSARAHVRASLAPLRGLMRRALRFCFPEMCLLDRDSEAFAYSGNSLRDSQVSAKSKLYPPFHIRDSVIDDHTYVSRNAWMSFARIGKFCSIGPNVTCGGGIHPTDAVSTSPIFYSSRKQTGWSLAKCNTFQELRPIEIGHDVFIGANVTILDGVTIGSGAIVGAGCVVSRDVPPYAIVAGCPLRILRYRFDEDIIEGLLRIKWWDWPEEKLREVEKYFFDAGGFIRVNANSMMSKGMSDAGGEKVTAE